jgi:hypothetical protein
MQCEVLEEQEMSWNLGHVPILQVDSFIKMLDLPSSYPVSVDVVCKRVGERNEGIGNELMMVEENATKTLLV